MKTKVVHNNINQIFSKKFGLRILGILLLFLFSVTTFASQTPTCSITKQNGSGCFSTTLTSVTANIGGTYTIVLTVVNDGSPGPACKTLSHYSVEADQGTYSNVLVNVVSGSMQYDHTIAMGPNLGASTPFQGFKIDNTSSIGDNHAGVFTVTYTITSLQNQQTDASAGGEDQIAAFTIADFQQVLNCPNQTGPTAVNDVATTPLNTPVVIDALFNDIAGSTAINQTSLIFTGTLPNPTTVGIFSFSNTTHKVTFTPVTGYNGTAIVSYQIKDANNLTSTATITVTILPGGPTAVNDVATTPLNTPVVIDALFNDIAGSTAIDQTSLIFTGTLPNPTTVGIFSFSNTTHKVTFTPVTGYNGTAIVSYQIKDANNLTSTATITVTITTSLINNYPATGYSTIAFEDLWPSKGDYDMNDLVLDYKFVINSNTNNYVDKVVGTFVIKAFGASLENGFGFQLPGIANAGDLTVSGYSLKESFINLGSNGTELGQAKPTIIVYDNAFKQMTSPGGIGCNTDQNYPYVQPKTLTITITFKPNTYTLNDLDIAHFNPFLIVNKVRGVEVHLPDYAPTSLANTNLFGTGDDNSSVAQNRYYKTANNLPWAINTYEQFDYPKEKVDISQAYLHFAAWATGGGISFQDWYKDLTGYRNASLIYQIPQ
jgi:LruC domain-containing protein